MNSYDRQEYYKDLLIAQAGTNSIFLGCNYSYQYSFWRRINFYFKKNFSFLSLELIKTPPFSDRDRWILIFHSCFAAYRYHISEIPWVQTDRFSIIYWQEVLRNSGSKYVTFGTWSWPKYNLHNLMDDTRITLVSVKRQEKEMRKFILKTDSGFLC